jgi:c-di-GMP-binding flagellar brake protein YcgR
MNPDVVVKTVAVENSERRRYPRYRYSRPIVLHLPDASELQSIIVEISECGMSAVASGILNVGDVVEAEPIGGGIASAAVRRKFGRFYGFEFLNLRAEQTTKIKEICSMLPLYHSKTLDLWH